MGITIHSTFLPHDPDASLAFYRDTLGFEVRNDDRRPSSRTAFATAPAAIPWAT